MEYPSNKPRVLPEQRLNELLAVCPLFSEWPVDRLRELASSSELKHYARSAQLSERSWRKPEVLVVVSGAIHVETTSANGGKYTLAMLGPGEVMWLMHLLGEVPMIYTAHVRKNSALVQIPAAAMRKVLDAEPILWRSIAQFTLRRFHASVEAHREWALGSVRRRMVLTLIALGYRHGDLNPQSGVDSGAELQVTQAELASMLGVSRQTIAKELWELKKEGLLAPDKTAYRRITVSDMAGLLRIAAEP